MDLYQQYIHISKYARYIDSLGRRETWPETVQRYIDFFDKRTGGKHHNILVEDLMPSIVNLQVMPSMRCLMSAGEALERENIAGYNCSYLAVNTVASFAEALYILMCGTGVGFSCERQEIAHLPVVPGELTPESIPTLVRDSKRGWAEAIFKLFHCMYAGTIPQFDYSLVRPAGARLRTFGGRASGPAPLKRLVEFTREKFEGARGRRLNSIEVHDIMCMIGEIVVVGGVRRSALISLSNLSDQRMRDAKMGNFREDNKQRELANNSVAYTEKPSSEMFIDEWQSLIKSRSGERGIFNREAACKQAARWGRRAISYAYGCNPCSEIILRDKQLCNLSEVVIREDDTMATLMHKVRNATIMGTLQASLTDFKFLSEEWNANTEEECLLGVSLTGIEDNKLMRGDNGPLKLKRALNMLRDHARTVNALWADLLGIKPAAAITCVKPSGTVSQLCNTASGIHARYNEHYIRAVRVDKKDPLYNFMVSKGVHVENDESRPDSTAVVNFAIKAPANCVTRDERTAIESLELWLMYQREWCEHKPSVTITVREHEWMEVGAWVYKHFDEVSGVSFLPHSNHTYTQLPYQDLTEEQYDQWQIDHPEPAIDWTELHEEEDNTESMQTLACTANLCEV